MVIAQGKWGWTPEQAGDCTSLLFVFPVAGTIPIGLVVLQWHLIGRLHHNSPLTRNSFPALQELLSPGNVRMPGYLLLLDGACSLPVCGVFHASSWLALQVWTKAVGARLGRTPDPELSHPSPPSCASACLVFWLCLMLRARCLSVAFLHFTPCLHGSPAPFPSARSFLSPCLCARTRDVAAAPLMVLGSTLALLAVLLLNYTMVSPFAGMALYGCASTVFSGAVWPAIPVCRAGLLLRSMCARIAGRGGW